MHQQQFKSEFTPACTGYRVPEAKTQAVEETAPRPGADLYT